MKSAYVVARGSGHQVDWGTAFSDGLRRHGWSVTMNADWPSSSGTMTHDLLVLWGVRRSDVIERQKADGGQICVLERGYVGDRFRWTSVSFGGGLNGRATFRGVRNEPTRFDGNFGHIMQPWRNQDGYALIIGQVPGDMSLAGCGGNLSNWYDETAEALKAKGYDVRFRAHPLAGRGGPPKMPNIRSVDGTLEQALAGASMCFTWNSNTAVESVLAGIPTMTADRGSMAWNVTSHSPADEPVTPDRAYWANRLAWCQWTLEEMASGECWEAVGI